jgi:DNA polymerase III delta subunit
VAAAVQKRALNPAQIVRDAGKKRSPVYLLVGEPFQTEGLARRLIEILVPEDKRAVNLETYDGRTADLAAVLDSCRTVGLFGNGKVVWLREPAFLVSGEKRPEVAEALFGAWSADRRKQAAEKLLLLAALAGWEQAELEATSFATLNKTKAKNLLGRDLGAGEADVLDAVKKHAVESEMTVASQKDDGALLEDFLASGAAGDTVLIFTSQVVDRRKKVFKELQKQGVFAELTLERERSGALTRAAVEALIDDVTQRWDKRPSAGARRLIAQRAGGDPGALQAELEKLCLHAGEATAIEESDVRGVMRDLGESWVFDFTAALAQRNAVKALALLRGLFAQGEPALRLLAMITREIRTLLAAREILSTSLSRSWSAGTQYDRFRDSMLPQIPDEQKQLVGGAHPYVLFLALQNASRTSAERLERALLDLHELDVALKSSRTDPQIRLEAFVLAFARR